MYAPDDIGAIVADIGSFSARIGFSGEDIPRTFFQTNDVGTLEVSDWEILEKVWDHALQKYSIKDIKDSPVLMTEKPYNSPSSRHKTCELMFEKYSTSAFFLTKDAVLSCYACGKTSGLIIDAGASETVVSPVQDGWVDMKAVNRCAVGGRVLDSHVSIVLRNHLKRTDVNGNEPSFTDAIKNLEIGRDFKETVCRMADSTVIENDPRFTNLPLIPYELPDGTMVDVGIERFQLPELYIDPSPINWENPDLLHLGLHTPAQSPETSLLGLPALIRDSVIRSDNELQTNLLANMMLVGGCANFEGMSERLRYEVERLVHVSAPGWRVRMTVPGVGERALCPWLGGSILGSMGSFHEVWVSRQEYEEFGSAIVDRKCP